METSELNNFRVILKKEGPSTDIKNINGVLSFLKNKIRFVPFSSDSDLERTYSTEDLTNVFIIKKREWFKKKEIVVFQFMKGKISVSAYFEPYDVSSEYLKQKTLEYQKKSQKGNIKGAVESLIEKISTESQKIVREVGIIIDSSSKEITQALEHTSQFIKETTKSSNLLDNFDINFDDKAKTISLNEADINEILKRSLKSGKIEAMISGLIAKGLILAKDNNFDEAKDTLNIAREAATKENMEEYTEIVNENIKEIEKAESNEDNGSQLSEKAMKYANEARKIVAEWENNKKSKENDNQI